jgi:hypothetical protein
MRLKGFFYGKGDEFSGRVSHLGRFQGTADTTAEPPTAVWVAANGDTISGKSTSFEKKDCRNNNWCKFEETLEITGGTGRFAYAAGTATATGRINEASGVYAGRLKGSLTRQAPDDADLDARIFAPSHPVDVDGDGVKEQFEFDIAALGDGDDRRGAIGGAQIRDGKIFSNLSIVSGELKCADGKDRPVLEMNSTSITSRRGNRGEVEVQQDVALSVMPANPGPSFNDGLIWTLHFTDTVPIVGSAAAAPRPNAAYNVTLHFTDTVPVIGFLAVDPCPIVIP